MIETIHFTLNGKPVKTEVDSDRMLLWVLRTNFQLTGTKYGCGESFCGACTVLVNNEAVRSCGTAVKDIKNKNVVTIEGLEENGKLHPIQKAFIEHDSMQCGYCTPGMIMNAYSFLLKNSKPTTDQILEGMNDNLCRCGAHNRIVQAIHTAAEEMEGVH
jgi:aerobic-type carbon monoxide dehydrogenase small subunit (CoxS/CutS family)